MSPRLTRWKQRLWSAFGRIASSRAQSTVEYLLVIAVIVIAIWAAFGPNGLNVQGEAPGRTGDSFEAFRKTVEAPYP